MGLRGGGSTGAGAPGGTLGRIRHVRRYVARGAVFVNGAFYYRRPDALSRYYAPDGTSLYLRP